MGHIRIPSKDDFELGLYEAKPEQPPKGAVLVIQEIFGFNTHIREVADGYAAAGYLAIAPKLFDRAERDIELGYEGEDMQRGIDLAFNHTDRSLALADLQAGIDYLRPAATGAGVGVVGYCFGGLMTWLSACELSGVGAASAYYGGGIAGELERTAKVPVMMHFGDQDAHIPMSDVDKVRAAQPAVQVHVYGADHGFNCDHRGSYHAESAAVALERTLGFFAQHIGG